MGVKFGTEEWQRSRRDCFRCLDVASSDNNDIQVRGFLLTGMGKDNLMTFDLKYFRM